jgi:hypothetical protein
VQNIAESLLCETGLFSTSESELERNCCTNQPIRGGTDKTKAIQHLSVLRLRWLSVLLSVTDREMHDFSCREDIQGT